MEKSEYTVIYDSANHHDMKKPIRANRFYEENIQPQEMVIGNGYFAVYHPQDGHMPQLCVDEPDPRHPQ